MSPDTPTIESDFVAVAADDADVVLIAEWGNDYLRVSTNGGTSWSDLDTSVLTDASPNIIDIDVSSEVNGIRYVAVATTAGQVFTRKFGASWEEWKEASYDYNGYAGVDTAYAVKFSPNFPSDRTLTAVTENSDHGYTYFEMLVFTSVPKWNDQAGLVDYPAPIYDSAGGHVTGIDYAYIALAPDYPGGGEV
jgi:hypothetical protein